MNIYNVKKETLDYLLETGKINARQHIVALYLMDDSDIEKSIVKGLQNKGKTSLKIFKRTIEKFALQASPGKSNINQRDGE